MRRSTPHCAFVAAEQKKLLQVLAQLDAVAVIQSLEQFVTPERAKRLRGAIDARLDSVAVLMDAPHDPHNGAAVLRSCDAFGIQRLHIIERYEPFLCSRQVSRGSERWVDVRTYERNAEALAALAASGHELIATHPDGDLAPADLANVPRFALVLGNERDGIHEELRAACKRAVRVPMRGFAESLNVSVTGAILLHHATNGRAGDLPEGERNFLYARALVLTVARAAEILKVRGMPVDEMAAAAVAVMAEG